MGAFLPPVVSFLKRSRWPTWATMALTVAVCLVAGTANGAINGTVTLNGDIIQDTEGLLAASAASFTSATVVYKTFFQNTAVNDTLTGVDR